MQQESVKFLDAKELAAMLHVSLSTINRLAADNEIPECDYIIAGQKKRLWKLSTIMKHLEEKCKNPKKEHSMIGN